MLHFSPGRHPLGAFFTFCYCWPFLCLSYPTELRMRAVVNIPSAVFVPHFGRKSPSEPHGSADPNLILGRRLLLPGHIYTTNGMRRLDIGHILDRTGGREREAIIRKFFRSNKTGCLVTHCGNFPLQKIGFRWPNENHRVARLKMMRPMRVQPCVRCCLAACGCLS